MKFINRLRKYFDSTISKAIWVPEKVYSDDIFVVSYPKSGNTWMRFLIGNYLTGNECTFENCREITPDIHMNPEHCAEVDRPRFIKSHAPYCPQYPNVVYIVRDGRDVAVSYYHHCIRKGRIESDTPFRAFLEMFNEGKIDDYEIWGEHVTSWVENAKSLLLVRYEDLQEDAETELRRVLEFSGVELREKAITSAVEASSFENMKETEKKERDRIDRLKDDEPTKRFMRKGETGEWSTYFDDGMHDDFLRIHETGLRRAGYFPNP